MREELTHHGYEILAHHGSLSQHIREQAEEMARKSDAVIIFATSTLELGIDIGDIDLVVLNGPAPNVSDLLQRIGRCNRRTNKTRVLLCASNERDALINTAMLEAARNGYLGDDTPGPTMLWPASKWLHTYFSHQRVTEALIKYNRSSMSVCPASPCKAC